MVKIQRLAACGSVGRQGHFYSDPSIVDGEVADLAKAGLPEK